MLQNVKWKKDWVGRSVGGKNPRVREESSYLDASVIQVEDNMSFFFFFVFLGLHLQQMEVPRLGVESELQLLAYTTATATPDPSHICNLHQSSQQCQILKLLSEARDQTYVLMDTSQIPYH